MTQSVLTDGVISVRRPTEADAEPIAALVRESIDHLLPWMVWASVDYSADDAMAWMTNAFDPTAHPFVMVDARGQLVGSCGLNDVREANGTANLGYWVGVQHTGNGHATRATDLLLRWALIEAGLSRIEVLMSVENEASRLVAERSQAIYEGIRRGALRYEGRNHDAHCFALIARDLSADSGGPDYV